jgi:ABC-type transport system substrate-binding protein
MAEGFALPGEPFYESLDRVLTKYPFDLRLTETLMREAGFTKGSDGVYVSAEEGRFAPELLGIAEGQEGLETTAVADYWRRAGIDAQLRLVPSAQMQASDEMKATYPAWRTNQAITPNRVLGDSIATAENRWAGTNKGGYSNPEHDRLYGQWLQTLDRAQRNDLMVQIYKSMNENLPALPTYFNFWVIGHVSELAGPQPRTSASTLYGNLHEWRWVR